MNEIISPFHWGPTIFGVQGPDTGNAEIIAHYGTPEQRQKYLEPLLNGEIFSAFSMTEPQGGADPLGFECSAVRTATTGSSTARSSSPRTRRRRPSSSSWP